MVVQTELSIKISYDAPLPAPRPVANRPNRAMSTPGQIILIIRAHVLRRGHVGMLEVQGLFGSIRWVLQKWSGSRYKRAGLTAKHIWRPVNNKWPWNWTYCKHNSSMKLARHSNPWTDWRWSDTFRGDLGLHSKYEDQRIDNKPVRWTAMAWKIPPCAELHKPFDNGK